MAAAITTQVVATGVNIVLNLWWIPLYGIMGAALASLVSYALEALLITTAFTRAASEGLRDTLVLQRADLQEYRSRAQLLLDRLGWVR